MIGSPVITGNRTRHVLIVGTALSLLLCTAMHASPAASSGCGLATLGCIASGWEQVERTAAIFLCQRGISCAVIGVLHQDQVVVRRAYGWHDAVGTQPLRPDALLRIASLSKPFTAVRGQAAVDLRPADELTFATRSNIRCLVQRSIRARSRDGCSSLRRFRQALAYPERRAGRPPQRGESNP